MTTAALIQPRTSTTTILEEEEQPRPMVLVHHDLALLSTDHGDVHTIPGDYTYLLYGPVPPVRRPSAKEVDDYIRARRFNRVHYTGASAYWDQRDKMQQQIDEKEALQAGRFSKRRANEIKHLTAMRYALGEDWYQISAQVNWACSVIQDYRNRFYGYAYAPLGERSMRHFADGWARSFGRLVRIEPRDRPTPARAMRLEVQCTRDGCWKALYLATGIQQDNRAAMLAAEVEGLERVVEHERETGHICNRVVRWAFERDHA